jgi:hypothetical protein
MDLNGELTEVTDVSDSSGIVISEFNVLDNPTASYGDYAGTVSISTTQQSEAIGGSLFIKVGEDIYKYNKTTLPLSLSEDGTAAAVLASGVINSLGTTTFGYDGYTRGGLSYIKSDIGIGYYVLEQMSDSTVSGSGIKAVLNVPYSEDVILGRDYSDFDTIYYIDSSNNIYLFDIDPNSVAFCNVVTQDPAMQAGSDDSTSVTAFVVNLYGDALQSKEVAFAITQGAGSITPSSGCSTSSGTVSTTFTVGEVAGLSIVTATASNDSC